jgi:hypothetical protein
MKTKQEIGHRNFFRVLLFVCAIFLGASASFCLFIDPFSLFNFFCNPGLNEKKFSYFMREAFIKPYQIKQAAPHTIFIGNSIANTGFDLSDELFAKEKIYSMGMAGIGIYGNFRTIQNIDGDKKIIWFLDFWNFLGSNESNSYSIIENSDFGKRLAIDKNGEMNPGHYSQVLRDYGLALFSWEAIQESIYTIEKQQKNGWHLLRDGTWGGKPDHTGKSQKKSFQYMEKVLFEDLDKASRNKSIYSSADGSNSQHSFELALRWIYQHKTSTILVIPPAHARWYESLFVSGYWNQYKGWKKEIIKINENLADEFNTTPISLWDFSGYNTYTLEPVPDLQDKITQMRYFSDDVHFSHELGAEILRTINNVPTNNPPIGTQLGSNSVSSQLSGMEKQHLLYLENQTQQTEDIWQLCDYFFKHQPDKCLKPEQQQLRYEY